jgi:murein DD-endopeptidase MepM/ murein hydrolase activator NlpD
MARCWIWMSALVAAAIAMAPPGSVFAACLPPPVDAPIADGFRQPPCQWCPGHRGVEYAVAPGTVVRAVAAGTVTFAGPVAGVVYVVVEHADGLRATYGRLRSAEVDVGTRVAAGATVGWSGDGVHFGLRRGETYVDPEPLLGRLVSRARLVPTDGTPARPAPPPRLRCRADPAGVARGPAR